VSNSVWRGV